LPDLILKDKKSFNTISDNPHPPVYYSTSGAGIRILEQRMTIGATQARTDTVKSEGPVTITVA